MNYIFTTSRILYTGKSVNLFIQYLERILRIQEVKTIDAFYLKIFVALVMILSIFHQTFSFVGTCIS